MFQKIIALSLRNKFIVLLGTVFLVIAGMVSLRNIPLDAVPDITNNQVQVVTVSPSLATEEVEQFITYPIEIAMANLPGRLEVRSISRYGLSVVTVVFGDDVPVMLARQYVSEQLAIAKGEIPAGLGDPELMPITTGLGEIYQYVIRVDSAHKHLYDNMQLRTMHDWIIKRQLTGIEGIVEVSSFGGYLKQYEVALNPMRMNALDVHVEDIYAALQANNANTGGGYIEKGANALYIRTQGLIKNLADLEIIPVANRNGVPVLVRDVASVRYSPALRYGAMTMDGEGETVGGITLMLKGANSYEVVGRVKERMASIQKSLPQGVYLEAYLDRSALISKTVSTATKNLIEGGLIVIFILLLLLGDWRSALIVASVIPLAMLFALILMDQFGVSANLMSLGAIDFGIVVDGAVIIVEAALFSMHHSYMNKRLTGEEMDNLIDQEAGRVYGKAAFGVLIILVVFLPILALVGVEGKMFRPMAQTVSFALLGALVLSLTYVPVAASLFLSKTVRKPWKVSEKIMLGISRAYKPALNLALNKPGWVVSISLVVLIFSGVLFSRMGSEFLPDLEEGDLAMQMSIKPGSALSESIRTSTKAEKILMDNFPEIKHVVSKIGTAEVPTDPMAIEDADIMIILKPKEEWVSADNREDLANQMKQKLEAVLGASFEFTQPIQLRFNELISGAKADIAIQIFGDDTDELFRLGNRVKTLTEVLPGAADLKVEQTEGLPQLRLVINREKMARYGINIEEVNRTVRAAFAGEVSGTIFENERRFDLVIRLDSAMRKAGALDLLYVNTNQGNSLPLREIAAIEYVKGPMQISRENARRRITIGVNVRNRDMGSLVADITKVLDQSLNLPPGYSYTIGGQYENFIHARERLQVAVPIALLLILVLLFFAFNSAKYALIIFAAVPLSAVGGVVALLLRGMPFSISAGVGFIALFGVAVLNGIVFIGHVMELANAKSQSLETILKQAAVDRLRPVLMTAAVAVMGFLPMALSTGAGAEVQKPLATVVIGGLISATFLTMLVLPALLLFIHNKQKSMIVKKSMAAKASTSIVLLLISLSAVGQTSLTREAALDSAFANNPEWLNAGLDVEQAHVLRNTAVDLSPINLGYNIGQLNAPSFGDYQFVINQSFGSLLTHVRKSQELHAREDLAQAALALKSRELKYEVALRYEAWIYAYSRYKLALHEFERFKQLGEKLEKQFNAGEISALEHNRNKNQVYQFYTLLLGEENKWMESTRQIKDLLLISKNISPADTAFLPRLLQPDSALSTLLLQPASLAVSVQEKHSLTQRASFFPEFSLGYMNQKIETDVGLQGFYMGMTIPLWFVPQSARVKEAQIEALKRQNDYEALEKRFDVTLKTQWATYANYRVRWQESISEALKSAEDLQTLAEQSFLQGEIDYLNLAQSIESALALKFTYLENLFLMNQSAIKLEYLVNPE